jgi:hypothetical protein
MRAKAGLPLALMLTVIGFNAAWGSDPPPLFEGIEPQPMISGGTEVSNTAPPTLPSPTPMPYMGGSPTIAAPGSLCPGTGPVNASAGLSDWLTYVKPGCCGPVGGWGPIMTELYVRNGPSIPVGGGVLGFATQTGWMFQGGGRSMFFNPAMTAAWVWDIGISHNYNAGIGGHFIPIETVAGPLDLQLRQFQRTCFNLGFGREVYLYVWEGSGTALRWGVHVAGQLGTIKADWEEIEHSTDMLWAITLASNLDLEIPWGCATLYAGFRVEWNDIFESDIVQTQNNNNLQSVNLLLSTGFRF